MALFRVSNNRAQFDAAGNEATDQYGAGIRFTQGGNARVTTASPTNYNQGIPMSGTGQVAIVDATAGLPAGTIFHNGLPISGDKVCVSRNVTAVVSNGLPYDAAGAVAGDINFDLNFIGTNTLNSSVTFTRTGTGGTFFNSAGVLTAASADQPRFDYNPATLAAQGLLIEEQRTNILASSVYTANANGWTNGVIGGTGTIAAAAVNSPAGTTAGVFNISGLNGSSYVGNFVTTTSSSNARTGSVFVKNNGGVKFQIRLSFGGATFASYGTEYDFTTGVFQDGIAGTTAPTSRSVTDVGNGWLRITITGSDNGTGNTTTSLQFWGTATTTNYNYLFWGAQIEQGAAGASAPFPTSYIPTTTTALTRSADVASVNTLAPWFNAAEGTLFSESLLTRQNATAGTNTFYIWNAATNEIRLFYRASGATGGSVLDAGVLQADLNPTGVLTANTVAKLALAYKANDFAVSGNGGTATTDPSGTVPTGFSQVLLGGPNGILNGYLRRIVYYPTRLSNAQLQAITA